MMRTVHLYVVVCWLAILAGGATQQAAKQEIKQEAKKTEKLQYVETDTGRWLIHDVNRPAPPVITPGTESTQSQAGQAPSDAIVLFDGTDLSEWTSRDGGLAKWIVRDGYMEAVKRSGPVKTKKKFGSCQLHVEFATPSNVKGSGQGRGNSGVFLMDTYEVQILDSYDNETYPDGQCAALYGRAVPLVNACRGPGEWQSYDIIFHRPIFKGEEVVKKATFTVFQNGVLVHDHVVLVGGTGWKGKHAISDYAPHEDKLPVMLQDHGNPVRFRNIWIRELAD
jgi:hypothetical protein